MDKRIGAQLYTVRDFCQNEADFENTIKKVYDIGYRVVQLSGVSSSIPAEKIKEICDKYSMTIACTHVDINDFENKLDEVIKYHKTVGTNIAGMSYIPPERREDIPSLVKSMNEITEKLAKEGITFAHHNHAYEFSKLGDISIMDYMIENGKFDFIVDVYWLAFAGINPAEFIKKLGSRVKILHYKDLAVTINNVAEYAEVGKGNIDWDSVIAVSDNAEFALVEQDKCNTDPFECLGTSYKYLKEKGFN